MTVYRIRPLDAEVDSTEFHCGQSALDEYIKRYASQDLRRNLARVFVVTPEDDLRQLAGYFTLSAGSVRCSEFPAVLARKLPRYPVPVALIGRLAVDKAFQGKRIGSILLADACQKVIQASAVLAVAAIYRRCNRWIGKKVLPTLWIRTVSRTAESFAIACHIL